MDYFTKLKITNFAFFYFKLTI